MRTLELRRHAERMKDQDALTPEGRSHAESVGRSHQTSFSAAFVSPATRAAETVAWILRGAGRQLPSHAIVPGLLSEQEERWRAAAKAAGSGRVDQIAEEDPQLVQAEAGRMKAVLERLLDQVPDHGTALVVGHSPLLEAGVYGLTGVVIEPLSECQGVALTRSDQGEYRLTELR